MATHSCILAWKTPWTEEPDGLQYLGLQKGEIAGACRDTTEQLDTQA